MAGVVGASAYFTVEKAKTTILRENFKSDENTKLFKAAYNNDLAGFKEAIKEGANLKSLSVKGDNCLMVALKSRKATEEKNDVVTYILSNDEICKQLDFKVSNSDGITASDIIKVQIEYREKGYYDSSHRKTIEGQPASDYQKFALAKIVLTSQI